MMSPENLKKARNALGILWGLERPLRASELGRVLGLQGRDPGRSVLDWEAGKTAIGGPVELAIWYMLQTGKRPPTFTSAIK